MKKEQILRILLLAIIGTVLMLGFEILFNIDSISNAITNWVASQNTWLIYIAIWLIMFLQVSVIPIPAIIVITAAIGAGVLRTDLGLAMFGLPETWLFILVTMFAYMLGACISYLVGRKWGRKAVKWCAGSEEDYDKWANFLGTKGKWPYAITVLLPVFPDDLLCLVAGSVKFDFSFFFFSNLIGRTIGLLTTLFSLVIIGAGGGSPIAMIAWIVALVLEIIGYIIIKFYKRKDKNKTV